MTENQNITFQDKEHTAEIIEDKKKNEIKSEDSKYNLNLTISSKNQNILVSKDVGNSNSDNAFLTNKRKAENNFFDDIKGGENSLDLKNINPNLDCNNIYYIMYLFNIFYSLYAL